VFPARRVRWVSVRMRLRSRSQPIALALGFALTVVGAWAWYKTWLGPIRGSLAIGVGASILAAAIVAYLSPANEAGYRKFISFGIVDMWSSRHAIKDWVDWMETAHETCVLFGIAHGGWCKDARFPPALKERLNHGVSFRVLFLDPNCKAAEIRAREEKRETKTKIRESIKKMWEIRQQLTAAQKGQLRIFVYDATASCGMTWVDQQMLVTHYLAGLPDETSPALLLIRPEVGMERSLYDVYADNLDKIVQHSTLVDESNIQDFLPKEIGALPEVLADTSAPPSASIVDHPRDPEKA
jgi:Domain of unknown function (DUF5919)